MKICAACHTDLPKDSYSKKQWKLDECQRRCKVCTANNREVQPPPQQNDTNYDSGLVKLLDSICLDDAAEISDEKLFAEPPSQYGDCPICFLRLPSLRSGYRYMACCGKVLCSGCIYAPLYDDQGNKVDNRKCPFCRTAYPKTEEEQIERCKVRMNAGDAFAIHGMGYNYQKGKYGFPRDFTKALQLFYRAGKLDLADAYNGIGSAYEHGQGVEVDKEKARHYYELAAIKGGIDARFNLGCMEGRAGNIDRSLKHHLIAVRSGDNESLKMIKGLYSRGYATKEDYTKALQSYQTYLGEIKSKQRDEAAAYSENYRYY